MTSQIENDDWPIYAVYVTRVGLHRSKVFNLLRQVLELIPVEAKTLLNSPRIEVARGPRMLVEPVAFQFRSAGAEVEIARTPDEADKTPSDGLK